MATVPDASEMEPVNVPVGAVTEELLDTKSLKVIPPPLVTVMVS
jgi:hypothetical protein